MRPLIVIGVILLLMFSPVAPLLLRYLLTGTMESKEPGNDAAMAVPALLFFTVPGGIVLIVLYLIWLAFSR